MKGGAAAPPFYITQIILLNTTVYKALQKILLINEIVIA